MIVRQFVIPAILSLAAFASIGSLAAAQNTSSQDDEQTKARQSQSAKTGQESTTRNQAADRASSSTATNRTSDASDGETGSTTQRNQNATQPSQSTTQSNQSATQQNQSSTQRNQNAARSAQDESDESTTRSRQNQQSTTSDRDDDSSSTARDRQRSSADRDDQSRIGAQNQYQFQRQNQTRIQGQGDQFRFEQPREFQADQQQDRERQTTRFRQRSRADMEDRPAPPRDEDFYQADDERSSRQRDQYSRQEFRSDDRQQRGYRGEADWRDDRDRDFERAYSRDDDRRRDTRFEDREERRFSSDRRSEERSFESTNIGVRLTTDDSDRLIVRERLSRGLLAQADIRPGDVIVAVNNQPVRDQQTLIRQVRYYRGSGPLPVVVLRDGERQVLYIEDVHQYSDYGAPQEYAWDDEESAWLGVYLNARYRDAAVVQDVQEGSAADRAGVRPNDWIVSVNGRRVMSPGHLSQIISQMDPGQEIEMQVSRRVTGNLTATLTEREYEGDSPRFRPERDVNYEYEE